jgi:hypothetical protein
MYDDSLARVARAIGLDTSHGFGGTLFTRMPGSLDATHTCTAGPCGGIAYSAGQDQCPRITTTCAYVATGCAPSWADPVLCAVVRNVVR